MSDVNPFPVIMREARTDLGGHLSGQFSPENWESILAEAARRLKAKQDRGQDETSSWQSVVREFQRENFWGYRPVYQAPRQKKQNNIGLSLVWMIFSAFVLTLMALAWLGQIYTASDDPKDALWFFVALSVAVLNFVYFLWRGRNYQDR
jgi:hypothetical protein